ncbi:MAG: hypothetical protein U0744_01750 [Gemmataceae bacterium]
MKASRLGLCVLATFGAMVGQGWAQAPLVPSLQPVENYPAPPLGAILERPPLPVPANQSKTRSFFNRCGYGCDSDLTWFGCGGWRQQNQFVFGSCRTFFGDPCIPKLSGYGPHDPR